MRRFTRRAVLALSVALIAAPPALARDPAPENRTPVEQRQPNIVVFLADDLGYRDTIPGGDRDARTPNLAKLAAEGLSFDQAFVASPACAPSRAALLTGLMPARNGAEANHDKARDDIRKLPAYLQAQGYQVVAFGKVAHYKHTKDYGFDHFAHDTFHDPEGVPAAIAWLKARTDTRPLAIFIGSNWPHVPWPESSAGFDPAAIKLPPKSIDTPQTREARARYHAAVARMDKELGKTLAAVDATLGKESLVLFSSDHGAQWPFGKWNLYDTGTRTPLIVRWPGRVQPGGRTSAMVSWVDILPTLVEVAGGKPSAELDGQSFAAALRSDGQFSGRTEIFTTHNNDVNVNVFPMRSVRTARWKYIVNLRPDYTYTTHIDQWAGRLGSGAYFPSWRRAAQADPKAKAIVDAYYARPAEELYDLDADPDETRNLATDPRHKAVMIKLRARLSDWRRAQGDDHPVKGKPHFERGPLDGLPED
ncbi:sulfatase family protein [Sphingomonas sp.]|uniref:sulfatase family protein n=1 Tax=Sphingomonas sp. TaxID=28214 RepID=UPI003F709636